MGREGGGRRFTFFVPERLSKYSRWRWQLDEFESASLRRTSTGRHQHATSAADMLTVVQQGLFDGVLVDEGGHTHARLHSLLEAMRCAWYPLPSKINFHQSMAGRHPFFSARFASGLHWLQVKGSWWKLSCLGGLATSSSSS